MTSRFNWLWAVALVALFTLSSCGGGGGSEPSPGPAFNLYISASPEVGKGPLTVTFSATPSGGTLPYTYAWDFDGDGVTDSNAPTGQYIYSYPSGAGTSVASVTVTDGAGEQVSASRTITVTGASTTTEDDALTVRFNVSPQSGTVPFNAQFQAVVSGGKAPYSYEWDFDGDGTVDSSVQNPLYTYNTIGQTAGTDGDTYVHYPVLTVTDSRGITGTNLDDNDDDDNPDFKLAIYAQPPGGGMQLTVTANPQSGQAPLQVQFNAAVSGASDDLNFTWNFGDDTVSDPSESSMATHTYLTAGTWNATVTVEDLVTEESVTSTPVVVSTRVDQSFEMSITSNVAGGVVPFVVDFEAHPVNGKDPIVYQWDVFTDTTPNEDTPSVGDAPALPVAAVVTPDFSYRKNPTIHFGNVAGTGDDYSYVVRCVATDNTGNVAVSNLIRVVADPDNTTPYYESQRPNVVGELVRPVSTGQGLGESANPIYLPMMPTPWTPRANPAVASHATGVTFVMGGEVLDETGNFKELVDRGDSAYVFVPTSGGNGTGEGTLGKYECQTEGVMIKLSDGTAPAFPTSPKDAMMSPPQSYWPYPEGDTYVPQIKDPEEDSYAKPPPKSTLRSAPFQIVGSAAAVLVNERPETNPDGAYPGPGVNVTAFPPIVADRDEQFMPDSYLWTWPDSAVEGWIQNTCA